MFRQGTPQLPALEDFPKDSNLHIECSFPMPSDVREDM